MAISQEVVRRLSIQATSSGVREATQDLQSLAGAQQGVVVASSQSERATLSLEKRFDSIERRWVQQARLTQQYEKDMRAVNAAVAQNPALQSRATTVLEAARQKLDRVTGAANDNAKATGLARHELINLSRQAQDVAVSLAGGQSPFTVLFQQGSQIGDIFSSSQGSLRGFASQVASALTPVRLMALGLVAVGAAAVAAFASWKSFALALDDISRQAGVASSSMAKLQAAASFKGIGQNDFVAGIQQFSAGVYEAQHGVGELATVLRANGKSATDFNQAMEAGADIIKNAASDQQRLVLLQQMGLPATMQWVRFMSDGAEGIRRAKQEATEFGGAANDNLVRRARQFDEAWNRAWTNFGLYARSAFQVAISAGATVLDRMDRIAKRMGNASVWQNFYTPESAAAAGVKLQSQFSGRFAGDGQNPAANDLVLQDALRQKATQLRGVGSIDPEKLKALMGLEQQRIGILGQTATVSDQVRNVELQIAQARLNNVKISAEEERKLKDLARENALGITQIKAQADAYKLQADTVGMSVGQAAAYTAEQNRLNEALRNHQVLTEADKAAIHAAAAAMGEVAQASAERLAKDQALFDLQTAGLTGVDQQIAQLQFRLHGKDWQQFMNDGLAATMRLTDAMRQMNDAVKGFGQDLLSSLQQGKDLFTSLLGAASNFATKLANMGLDKMMSGLTGGGDLSKVFGGDIGAAVGKGIKQSLDDIELKSRNATTNPANGFMFNGSGGVGKGLAGIAAGLGIYAQGQQIGASGGSATTGALSGALSGALAGSAILPGIGTAIGAVVGGIAGLLGASDGAKKAAQQAKDDWANAKTAADLFGRQLAGDGQGSLTTALAQAKSQTEQYTIMAQKAKDQDASDRLGDQYNQYYKRMTESFRDSFNGIVDAFSSGLGPNSPFATGAKNVKDIGEELKGFIEDTKTAMDYLYPDSNAGAEAVAKATAASQQYLLSLLGQAPVLTDTQTAIQHLNGTAAQLQTTLVELGVSSQDAASAIQSGVLASMKQLADTFANGLQREINAASGQDYLNSLSDLVAKFQSNLADAASLGLGPDLVNQWFKVSAQKIVNDAGLAGDAISDLVSRFPSLAGVVTAASGAISAEVAKLQAIYDASTNSVSVAQAAVDESRANTEKAYQAVATRANEAISRLTAFTKSIQQFKDSLKLDQNLSPLDPYQRLQEAQKQFQQTSVLALSGNQDAMDRVQDVSRSYLEEAKAYYGSSAQYFDIFNAVNSVLDSALATANSQLTAEQQSLALLNQQVDGLITINDSVLSIGDAIAAQTAAQNNLAQAVLAQSQAAANLINANPNAATGNVDLLYQSILGRNSDAAGKAYWQSQIAAGMSGQDLIKAFISGAAPGADAAAAAAYAAKYGYQRGGIVGSYATGGIVGNGLLGIDSVMARYAGGGYIGLAGGEYVMPTSQTRANLPQLEAMRSGRSAGNDNDWREVLSELRALRQQNADLTQRLIAVTGAGAQMNVEATQENTGAVRQQADAARREKYQRKAT